LSKAALVGLVGAVVGSLAGLTFGLLTGQTSATPPGELRSVIGGIFPLLFLFSLVLAPLLSVIASWLPAMLLARQDPALVLQSD